MMFFSISTGFFAWNLLKWLVLFLVVAAALSFAVRRALKHGVDFRGGAAAESIGAFSRSGVRSFLENCIEPWLALPFSPLLGLGALFLLFVIAVFLG